MQAKANALNEGYFSCSLLLKALKNVNLSIMSQPMTKRIKFRAFVKKPMSFLSPLQNTHIFGAG